MGSEEEEEEEAPAGRRRGEQSGSRGSRMPVRGIFHSSLLRAGLEVESESEVDPSAGCGRGESTERSVRSSPTPVAMTGREPETRPIPSRQRALTTSNNTMTRQRVFSPARFASISRSNWVY